MMNDRGMGEERNDGAVVGEVAHGTAADAARTGRQANTGKGKGSGFFGRGTRASRRRLAWLAVAVAVVVFAGSAAIVGANASGYERLKDAAFALVEKMEGQVDNVTFKTSASLAIDGVEMAAAQQIEMRDGKRQMSINTNKEVEGYEYLMLSPFLEPIGAGLTGESGEAADAGAGAMGDAVTSENVTYSDDEVYYSWNDGRFRDNSEWLGDRWFSNRSELLPEDEREPVLSPNERRLFEALADTLVGEMRNYFVSDGNRVSISLSGAQIPELAQAALAAATEQAYKYQYWSSQGNAYGRYYDEGPLVGMVGSFGQGGSSAEAAAAAAASLDIRFSHGSMEAEMDDAGNIVSVSADLYVSCNAAGGTREIGVTGSFEISDEGTTTLEQPAPYPYTVGEWPPVAGEWPPVAGELPQASVEDGAQ